MLIIQNDDWEVTDEEENKKIKELHEEYKNIWKEVKEKLKYEDQE